MTISESTPRTESRGEARLNLDWDEAYCGGCGDALLRVNGPAPAGSYKDYSAEEARDFIARSVCLYCGGAPIVPLMEPGS